MPKLRQNLPRDFWAITTYFNPCGYRSRCQNYKAFRRRLKAPLLTIELAYGSEFELKAGDATELIQVRSEHVMWQKERLINLALTLLPSDCQKVAWLDCDILFERHDWIERTSQALDRFALVQPFSQVHYLTPACDLNRALADQHYGTRRSMAAGYVAGNLNLEAPWEIHGPWGLLYDDAPGFAWAMNRGALEEVGLYDTEVVGGGVDHLAHAAMGTFEDFAQRQGFTSSRYEHYLDWARRFYRIVKGNIGVIDGDIYHLWHGELRDRKYMPRFSILRQFDFDPRLDVERDQNGCWRWSSDKRDLHDSVRTYFQERREDGR